MRYIQFLFSSKQLYRLGTIETMGEKKVCLCSFSIHRIAKMRVLCSNRKVGQNVAHLNFVRRNIQLIFYHHNDNNVEQSFVPTSTEDNTSSVVSLSTTTTVVRPEMCSHTHSIWLEYTGKTFILSLHLTNLIVE